METSKEATVLKLLAEQRAERQEDLPKYVSDPDATETDTDDERDSDTPVLDKFLQSGGVGAVVEMTSFALNEFNALWNVVEEKVESEWNTGRGRKSQHYYPKDVLFMLLSTLKDAGHWDFSGKMFGVKGPTFERMNIGFADKVVNILYETVVLRWKERYTMERLIKDNSTFRHYKFALYATDVTFQNSNRPGGNHEEAKRYFSNKHKLYGYKSEVSVLPNGIAIGCTPHQPGSVSDLTIFRKNIKWHQAALSKTEHEARSYPDVGPMAEEHDGLWAVLTDKGYQGAADVIRAIMLKKKSKGGSLSHDDLRINRKISSDFIIVENVFGRLSTLWAIMANRSRWDEKQYDKIFRLCLSLTDLHVKWHPLRDEDNQHAKQYRRRLLEIGVKKAEERKASQKMYRAKRAARMSIQLGDDRKNQEMGAGAMLDLLE